MDIFTLHFTFSGKHLFNRLTAALFLLCIAVSTIPSHTKVLLDSGNYFHWEFNTRMKLARKGLLGHITLVKPESEITETWLVKDAKQRLGDLSLE